MCQSSVGHHYLCNYSLSLWAAEPRRHHQPFYIGYHRILTKRWSIRFGNYPCIDFIDTKRAMGGRLFNWNDIYPSFETYHLAASGSCIHSPLSNTFISLLKDTSLASLILVTELFRKAQEIAAKNYEFLLLYIEAAALYWILCTILSFIQGSIEDKLNRYVAK